MLLPLSLSPKLVGGRKHQSSLPRLWPFSIYMYIFMHFGSQCQKHKTTFFFFGCFAAPAIDVLQLPPQLLAASHHINTKEDRTQNSIAQFSTDKQDHVRIFHQAF
jgi:hypothetical protein